MPWTPLERELVRELYPFATAREIGQWIGRGTSDLRNTGRPMDLDRAKAVASVASVLIDSARVEVEYLKATGGDKSEFLLPQVGQPRLTSTGVVSVSPGVTQHRLRG